MVMCRRCDVRMVADRNWRTGKEGYSCENCGATYGFDDDDDKVGNAE